MFQTKKCIFAKKIFLMNKILLLSFFYCYCFAQPVLNASDINSISNNYIMYSSESTLIPVSASGSNQVWDYSSLPLTFDVGRSEEVVTSAPLSGNFPAANFFIRSLQNVQNADYIYEIYNLNSTKQETLGLTANNVQILSYSNPSTVFVFPFTYGATFTDTYSANGGVNTNTITKIYDAYGTLTTSFGTTTDVMRIKEVDGVYTEYKWIALSPFRELMTAYLINDLLQYYGVNEITTLNTNTATLAADFKIYPNPTRDFIRIENTINRKGSFITIYDLLGNEIIKEPYHIKNKEINLSNIAKGMYFVIITNSENIVLHSSKFLKI